MLVAVSEVLKQFLQATVVPPLPHQEVNEWVQIAALDGESVSKSAGRLVLCLYSVEPDPFTNPVGGDQRAGNAECVHAAFTALLDHLSWFLSRC